MFAKVAQRAGDDHIFRIAETTMTMRLKMVVLKPQARKPCMLLARIVNVPRNGFRILPHQELPNIGRDNRYPTISATVAVSLKHLPPHFGANVPVRVPLIFGKRDGITGGFQLNNMPVHIDPCGVEP